MKKEEKKLKQKEPTLRQTVNKQEGTFLCHLPYFFGNKSYFSRNNLNIRQEKVLSCKVPGLRKFPGVLTFLDRMFGQLSLTAPILPTRWLSLEESERFPWACHEWTKELGEGESEAVEFLKVIPTVH